MEGIYLILPMPFTTVSIDFCTNFQTCYLTISDGRIAELATTELTPQGQGCDWEGDFIVSDYHVRQRLNIVEFMGNRDGEVLLDIALQAIAREVGCAWEITGLQYQWQRTPVTSTIRAANRADLATLLRRWYWVDCVTICLDAWVNKSAAAPIPIAL